jgi:hypothetical protein
MNCDILKRLNDPELAAVRCGGDHWPRSLLTENQIPDAWQALVRKPDGRRWLVPAGEAPRLEREDTLLLVRNRPFTVPLGLSEVAAADGHGVSAQVEVLTRAPARDDDLAAFLQALLSGPEEISVAALRDAFVSAGAIQALQRYVRARPASALAHDDQREVLRTFLQGELKRFLFAAGLVIDGLGRVDFTSASLAAEEALQRCTQQQVRALESRGVVERAALAATQRRLDDLGSVLNKLKTAAQGAAGTQWRELLPTLTPGERGRLLESLWRLTPDRQVARAIVVVAGRECAWLHPAEPGRVLLRVTLPDELGGLRAVDYDPASEALYVGAATGVWRLHAADGSVERKYGVPRAETPRTGFNASAISGERLFATHSQLGAWSWALDNPADVTPLLQPIGGVPHTVRAACVASQGHVLFAADKHVHAFDRAGNALWESGPADSAIHCLAPLENWVYAGTEDGALLRAELRVPGPWLLVHRVMGAIESLQARRWDDLVELVLPAGSAGVAGVYAEEGIVARLLTAEFPVRRAWASDDTLIGLTETRDRLIVLNGNMPQCTGVEVPLARILGRPIQDACMVTGPPAA